MKRIFYNLFACLSCAVLLTQVSCTDLDLIPEGDTITEQQKKDLLELDPATLQSDVNGLYSDLIKYDATYNAWYGGTAHNNFGYASACMMFDAGGQDVPSEHTGYNWFRNALSYADRTEKSSDTYFLWNFFYSHAKTANNIIAVVDKETDNPALKAFRGQALASRAFDYLHLVQAYQFTYKGHETAPAVPIVPEDLDAEKAGSNPRATVQEVYDFILADLNEAITLLDGYRRTTKGEIDQSVAYGLRARANLLMQNWADAAADADKALQGYGNTPYTLAGVSKPAFNEISASSWMWGCDVAETNDIVQTGIINFPSHSCSFTGNGYSPGYAGRYINDHLWQQIPSTDIRKNWWIDEDYTSPNVENTWPGWTATYQGDEYGMADWFGWNAPYLNVKFGPYKDEPDNATNACDFPLMRVEEMILIKAEGLAMSSGDGKSVLENFVKTYRNPAYICSAGSGTALQDEIWFQRRIELWGEGFSLFDLLRLKKPVNRLGTNYPAQEQYNLPAEAQILIWLLPEDEVNANGGISTADNNPTAPIPVP
jgi:hypothetical protein